MTIQQCTDIPDIKGGAQSSRTKAIDIIPIVFKSYKTGMMNSRLKPALTDNIMQMYRTTCVRHVPCSGLFATDPSEER